MSSRAGLRVVRSLWTGRGSRLGGFDSRNVLSWPATAEGWQTQRGALASAGVRWKSATVLSHDDEEDMEHEKKDAKVTNTKGFVLDPVAADLVAAHYRPKPMSPHVTVMKARFNTMLSISSRIGAVWLAAVMYVPTTSAWILFMEYVPIGHFNALGIFSLISLGAHITFLTQNKHMLRTKWGQKGDVWKKSHEV